MHHSWIQNLFAFILLVLVLIMLLCSNVEQFQDVRYPPLITTTPNSSCEAVSHVLLWTQIRSGSRFTGRILNMDASTFYVEEPVAELLGSGVKLNEINVTDFLRCILNCSFSSYPEYLKQRISHRQGKDLFDLRRDIPHLMDSGEFEERMCAVSKVRVVRVVIPDMEVIWPLLEDKNLNVRVVHLVRDVRAILASRENLKDLQEQYKSRHPCDKQRQDLLWENHYLKLYGQDRIVRLHYESLAKSPLDTVKILYRWIGLRYNRKTESFLELETQLSVGQNLPFLLKRKSVNKVSGWRKKMSFEEVKRIQEECRSAIKLAGYEIYNTKESFLNFSVS